MPLQLNNNNKQRRAPNTPVPGIDHNHPATNIYVFFGASREYGPNEGWQIVKNKRTVKKARRMARRRAEEARYMSDETSYLAREPEAGGDAEAEAEQRSED
jgi:hypothetical protein